MMKRVVQVVKKYGIVGVPFGRGQLKDGVQNGPKSIRSVKFLAEIGSKGYDVRDYGDVVYSKAGLSEKIHRNMKNLDHVAACHEKVSEKVQTVLNDGRVCVTLGGDHSLSIGTIDGHVKARGDVAVLWVDAHADLNTADTSPSGNIHGMAVALLAKELSDYWPRLPGMDWLKPTLSIKQFAYIGLRSVDEYERLLMDKFSIPAFYIEDIAEKGMVNVVHEALEKIDPSSSLPIHLSFDIDCLDPLEAPSTGTPVRGGMCLHHGIQVVEQLHSTGRLSAVDLVEVNTSIGDERDVELTLQAAENLLQAVFGHMRRGNPPMDSKKLVKYR